MSDRYDDPRWETASVQFKRAENGFLMREFDVSMAEYKHTVAATPAELAQRFDEWAAQVSRNLRKRDWA